MDIRGSQKDNPRGQVRAEYYKVHCGLKSFRPNVTLVEDRTNPEISNSSNVSEGRRPHGKRTENN